MKIDTNSIEGYAAMSAEEKLAALEALNLPDPDYSGWIKKDVFDKTAHELAERKRQDKERMSEDEKAKAEREERDAAMQKELEELRREKTVAQHKATLAAQGWSDDLANEAAAALADGNAVGFLGIQAKFIASLEKDIREKKMRDTPRPSAGFDGAGDADYQKMANEAASRGDMTAMAYYTRLAAEQKHGG